MYQHYIKRALDLSGGVVALTIFAIPMILVAIWVRLDSNGPAIFSQKRYGRNKQPFTIYKFRTMATSAPSNVATNDLADSASYITRAGKIMRKLSLDELPQLFNVIKGDMSMIGPRPVVLAEKRLIKFRDHYKANHLRPGISGWAQANGRDELDDATKAEMDGYYAERISFIMDVKCMILTAWSVVSVAGNIEGHEKSNNQLEGSVE